jgi:hypothetical protein
VTVPATVPSSRGIAIRGAHYPVVQPSARVDSTLDRPTALRIVADLQTRRSTWRYAG